MRTSIAVLFFTAGILAFLDSCAAAYNPYAFELGAREPYADKQFTREEIKKNPVGYDRKISEIKTFTTDGKARITMIQATNLKKNGAKVELISGGPGKTFVTLQFESAPGQGFHFMFTMYARYD